MTTDATPVPVPAPEPTPSPAPAPTPSPEDQRIDALATQITGLDALIESAETGRQRREYTAKRDALLTEKSTLQLRDVLKGEEKPTKETEASVIEAKVHEPRTGEPVPLALPDALSSSQQANAAPYLEDFGHIAADAKIPQAEMQSIIDAATDVHMTELGEGSANLANQTECMSIMQNRWGAEQTKNMVAAAQDAVRQLDARTGGRVSAYLDAEDTFGNRLSNSPAVIFALAAWATGESRRSPEQAIAALKELKKDPKYLAGDKLVRDRANLMNRIASRAQAARREVANRAAKPAEPSPREKVEARIKELRAHPAYFSRDHASHKEVVQQVSDLYAQLHLEKA